MMVLFKYIVSYLYFFFNDTATTEIYTLSLHDALPISARVVASRELVTVVAPLRFLVYRGVGYLAQLPDHGAVGLDQGRRSRRAWRLIHERHELVREARHRARDAYAAHVRASADPVHPAPLGHVAVYDRTPAADLHLALGRVVVLGEVALLVVGGPIAALVNGLPEEPRRPELVVERNHRRHAARLVEQPREGLHEVVRLHGTPGHVHDRDARLGAEVPSQIVRQSHATRGVARHRVDPAVGRAGPGRDHRPRPRRQLVDPPVEGQGLAGGQIVPERRPVPVPVDVLVGDGAFDHQDERGVELIVRRLAKDLQVELPAERGVEHLVVQVHRGQPRDVSQQDILEAGQRCSGHGDGVSVAAHALRDPQDVDLLHPRSIAGGLSLSHELLLLPTSRPLPHLQPLENYIRIAVIPTRSEERRVGKECRSRWSPYH